MKKRLKAKADKCSLKKSAASEPELPELVSIMMKIAERLEALEKKTDLVISQTTHRSFEMREHPKPAAQPFVPAHRPNEVRPAVQGQPQGQSQGQSHQGQVHERRERVLHKAVCADCKKDCEVPFKPTGERPVYCKECFSKRKSNRPQGQGSLPPKTTAPVNPPQRQVVVTKKGVGKVTVSEIVRHSARDHSQKGKSHKPAKKSKR
jgi:CxxC-x17-CxxC domain-containing protein